MEKNRLDIVSLANTLERVIVSHAVMTALPNLYQQLTEPVIELLFRCRVRNDDY